MGLNESVVTKTGWWNNHRGLFSFMENFNGTIYYPLTQNKETGALVFSGTTIWEFLPDGRWYQYENINDALKGINNYSDSGKWFETDPYTQQVFIRAGEELWDSIHGKWFSIPKMPKNWKTPRSEFSSWMIEDGSVVLHKGDHNPAVGEVQSYLLKLKYDVGPKGRDGFFGPDTEAAVKKFQKDNNLAVDGKVGKKTLKMLDDLALPIYRAESAETEAQYQRALKKSQTDSTTNQN
jgi:hypothetical protein